MTSKKSDRRSEERFVTPPHIDCSFASPVLEDFGKVKVTSISRFGIALIAAEALAPGISLAAKLVNTSKGFSKIVLARVIHMTSHLGGAYLVGGTLDTPLTSEELCAFII